jgi:hypothetical protein
MNEAKLRMSKHKAVNESISTSFKLLFSLQTIIRTFGKRLTDTDHDALRAFANAGNKSAFEETLKKVEGNGPDDMKEQEAPALHNKKRRRQASNNGPSSSGASSEPEKATSTDVDSAMPGGVSGGLQAVAVARERCGKNVPSAHLPSPCGLAPVSSPAVHVRTGQKNQNNNNTNKYRAMGELPTPLLSAEDKKMLLQELNRP